METCLEQGDSRQQLGKALNLDPGFQHSFPALQDDPPPSQLRL
jgi:hypothetical protein